MRIGVKVQKAVEISTFMFPKTVPICVIVPKFLGSFFNYFTTDLGADTLVLPLPKW